MIATNSIDRPTTPGSGRTPQAEPPDQRPPQWPRDRERKHDRGTAVAAFPIERHRARQRRNRRRGAEDSQPGPSRYANSAQLKERQRARQRPQHPAPGRLVPSAQAREPVRSGEKRGHQQREHEQPQHPGGHRLALQQQARSASTERRPAPCPRRPRRSAPSARRPSRRSMLTPRESDAPAAGAAFAGHLDEHSRDTGGVQGRPVLRRSAGRTRWASCPSALGVPGSRRPHWRSHRPSCAVAAGAPSRSRPRTGRRSALRSLRAREVAQNDHGVQRHVQLGRQPRGAGVAAAAAAGGRQHDCALGLARGEHACQLEQRGGARQLGPERTRPRRRLDARGSRSAWRSSSPGRSAITVRAWSPSIVWRRSGGHGPRSRLRRCRRVLSGCRATRGGQALIARAARAPLGVAGPPGSSSSANARGPWNASGASVEVSGVGRRPSENAASASANRKGTKAAR